ncbi:MAG: LegC family aminotransferase [Chitinophagaceae bacterium]|jgi:aminotransferase in exopolysaccharide biosynthesis|nr:LegC family aminotransferase [Chitinophagaceae bacterium]OQY95700.1 MAG: aminotransferase DegT [Sphingobacteriales bacterium UTBCD1]
MNFDPILKKIREIYNESEAFIPLHAPVFNGNEKKYLNETIDSTFVSSVGEFVNRIERDLAAYTGAKRAIAMVNGTTALQLALQLVGVKNGDEVITQPLTFIATANAISHAGALPVFVDVDRETLGMSPDSLKEFLDRNCTVDEKGNCINKRSRRTIKACVPMHTFGFPVRIDLIENVCKEYNLALVEDAAESLGSSFKDKSTGTFGLMGTLSFNGNKTITCGGGGAILTNNEEIADKAKHLSTTAKIPHAWEFVHDAIGYNYRMPNLNAALACAQLEQLDTFLKSKRKVSKIYEEFFKNVHGITFKTETANTKANYWLNTIIFDDPDEKEEFLKVSNAHKIMTRPIWRLMNKLPMYENCTRGNLHNSEYLEQRVVNIPSSTIHNNK